MGTSRANPREKSSPPPLHRTKGGARMPGKLPFTPLEHQAVSWQDVWPRVKDDDVLDALAEGRWAAPGTRPINSVGPLSLDYRPLTPSQTMNDMKLFSGRTTRNWPNG